MTESGLWILADCAENRSQLNGGRFWRLTFVNADTGETTEMTVDPAYNNFKKAGWDHVVADAYPYGIYSGLKRTKKKTKRGVPVVSADGPARLIYRCENDDELARLIETINQPEPTPFERLTLGS